VREREKEKEKEKERQRENKVESVADDAESMVIVS
jgi:hypothetical protein